MINITKKCCALGAVFQSWHQMSICHVILLLYEKTRSLGLNIDSQTNHQTSKGVAIGEISNRVVECIFSETNRNL